MLTKIPIKNIFRKGWFKVIAWTLVFVILIPSIFYIILRTSGVQTWITARVTHYLSSELKANIYIKGVDISWFLDVELEGIFISDQHKDTLLYAESLVIDVNRIYNNRRMLKIQSVSLKNPSIVLRKHKADSAFNYQFLVDYFSSTDTTSTPEEKKWKISVSEINLINAKLRYTVENTEQIHKGLDYNHLNINGLNLITSDLGIKKDTLSVQIKQLALNEKSGFIIRKMKGRLLVTPQQIELKDFSIRTSYSNIESDIKLSYSDISAFNNFIEDVTLSAYFLPSDIDFRDICQFAPALAGMNERVVLQGQVDGKLNNLKMKDIHLEYGSFTRFKGNIKCNGLPVIEETFIQLTVDDLTTNQYDLSTFTLPGGSRLIVPEELIQMGNIKINGVFTGFYNDFVSYARFRTDIGSVFTDVSYKDNSETGQIEYSGRVITQELNLGLLAHMKDVGKINMTADLTGSGISLDDLFLNLDGMVDSLYFKGNTFRKLSISGGISDRRFSGSMILSDPILGFEFDGFIDFKKKEPVFDFIAHIDHAWLNKLNLVKSDSVMGFKTSMKIHFEGLDPDRIIGEASFDSTRFRMNHSVYFMKHLALSVSHPENSRKNIVLTSDYADAEITGTFKWDQLIPAIKGFVFKYLPALSDTDKIASSEINTDLTFSINLKDTRPFSRMFFPAVILAENTTISGVFQPARNDFGLKATSNSLNLFGTKLRDWSLDASSEGDQIRLITGCSHLEIASKVGLDRFRISASGKNDSITYTVNWKNDNPLLRNEGDIGGYFSLLDSGAYKFHLNHSNTLINDSLWIIPGENIVEINSQEIKIKNLEFLSNDERIAVEGVISDNPRDILKVDFKGFDLSNIDFLTLPVKFNFDGLIDGKIELQNLKKAPNIASDIVIKNLAVNNDKLGNMNIQSHWDQEIQALFAKADIIYRGNIGENKPLSLNGYYYPLKKDNNLDFKIHIDNFKLKTISNFLSSFSSKFIGFASGDLTLGGNFKKPDLRGNVKVQRGVIRVDYLKTEYSFSQDFELGKNYIGFNNIVAYDSLGNKVFVNGTINHNYFYNFRIDLNIKPQNLLVLNTQAYDNDLFYGKAFGTGEVRIHGPANNIVIDINAKPEKGTQINLPINTTADISNNEFIVFGNTDSETQATVQAKPPDYTGVSMNLDLEATPDATVRIFMPDDMGTIKATGQGNLKVGVDNRGQFNIYGDYEINEGSFLFTLQNVINRLFQVQQGGRILFSGDPFATTVNLRAIYQLDVPLTGLRLSDDQTESLTKKIPMDCIIELKGNIFNPDLSFKLSTPEKDPEVNRIIFSQLDTNNQQQMSEQMIFLLVLKQFKPMERSNPLDLNASVGSSSWDIISSQLNSWLSQISKDFNVGVNYKPGDHLTNDELTVALSTQLFNERVIIDGNFGYNSGIKSPATSAQNASNLVGDVKVEVKLTDDGRIRVRAYNRSNNVALFENNSLYTQGVGIFFRKEFDTFKELLRGKKKKKEISQTEAVKPE
ncbi:MAG: translocation/assembly module TamB domain-containing protein [Bacteroidales bacterium]